MALKFFYFLSLFFIIFNISIYANACAKYFPMPMQDGLVAVLPIYDATIVEPDMDCDGVIDTIDSDIDGDMVPNVLDAFPLDSAETVDSDNDGIGNNADRPLADSQNINVYKNSNNNYIVLSGSDDSDPIVFTIVSQPSHGTLNQIAPNVVYSPNVNYIGTDRFTFKVNDGNMDSFIATVSISVQDSTVHIPQTRVEASAFLSRATFGARLEDIDSLMNLTSYEKWIDNQFAKEPSFHMLWAEENVKGVNGTGNLKDNLENWKVHSDTMSYLQRDVWWHIVTKKGDQLRQRMAYALSEIMVISRNGPLITMPDAIMSYYDVLVKHALGNYEELLQEVTYHPAMGKYLSYLGNAKANASTGSHPDENYAREVMQLFSIGLYELNMDGTIKLDSNNTPRVTYTQNDIEEMAKVFTGLSDNNGNFASEASFSSHFSRTSPMVAFESYHDQTQKSILGKNIAAGGNTKTDINKALNILFMHPNTAVFISKQLIQRLVTSNPSPAYVARVASVFNSNAQGIRGDLKAVAKAILLDKEALNGVQDFPNTFGKFREPLLYVTHLFRAFNAQGALNTLSVYEEGPFYQYNSYHFHGTGFTQQEGPLEALTVFNYYTPDDAPYNLKNQNLVAPELEIYGKGGIDDVLMGLINKNGFIYELYKVTAELQFNTEKIMVQEHRYDDLLEHLNIILLNGNLSNTTKSAIKQYMLDHEDDAGMSSDKLTRYTIGLVMTSPDYALQR